MELLAMVIGAAVAFSVVLLVLVVCLKPKSPPKQDVKEIVKKCKRCQCDK